MVAGDGELQLGGEAHALEPETGAYLAPGEEYELDNTGDRPLKLVSVRIPDPADPEANGADGAQRAVVRRLADQEAQDATTDREFRIVADPSTGLRSATHFVGYIPTARAPEHFHTYDEVIYVLDGEGVMHAEGNDTPVGAGSCIELPARTVHCLENTGDDVMRLVAVFRPAGSPAAAYYPDGTPAYPGAPPLSTQSEPDSAGSPEEEVESMKVRIIIAAMALTALVAAGCGSSNSSSSSSTSSAASSGSSTKASCDASIGIEGPFTGQVAVLGQEQLAFAKLAVKTDNKANGTNITLVQGDTQLTPAQATTVTQQFISNSKIVAVVGPAGSQEVEAVGPLFGRVGMAFITGSATNPDLTTSGKNPTFFRVVSRDDLQGPQDAHYIVNHLNPRR